MRLIMLCAAAPPGLRRGIFPCDEPLDALGLNEIALRAPSLPSTETVWTSPTPCATQTASALGWHATAVEALRECSYGMWAGHKLRDIEAADPQAYAAWLDDPAAAPHGGESIDALAARVKEWLDSWKPAGAMTALAVAPASAIRAALLHARGAASSSYKRIDIAPLTLTAFERNNDGWTAASS